MVLSEVSTGQRTKDRPKPQPKPRNLRKGPDPNRKQEDKVDYEEKHKLIVKKLLSHPPDDLTEDQKSEFQRDKESFLQRQKEYFLRRDKYNANLLHRLILDLKYEQGGGLNYTSDEVLSFIEQLVIDDPRLLVERGHAHAPLRVAVDTKLDIFFHVVNLWIPPWKFQELETKCKQKNSGKNSQCPLRLINKNLRLKFGLPADEQRHTESRNPTMPKDPDSDNLEICLHPQVNVVKLKKHNDLIRATLVEGMVSQDQWSCLPAILIANNFDDESAEYSIPLPAFQRLLQLCTNDFFQQPCQTGLNPLQTAILLYESSHLNYNHVFRVIEELVARLPASIYFSAHRPTTSAPSYEGKSAYRLLVELGTRVIEEDDLSPEGGLNNDAIIIPKNTSPELKDVANGSGGSSRDFEENNDPAGSDITGHFNFDGHSDVATVYTEDAEAGERGTESLGQYIKKTEDLLKSVCIGDSDKTMEEKVEFLYWGDVKRVLNISLILLGTSGKIDKKYIEMLKSRSGMEFETMLASVQLPYWNPSSAQLLSTQPVGHETSIRESNARKESDPYEHIFNWLRAKKVEKIFSIDVDDTGPEPHSNASIRRSLCGTGEGPGSRGFQVEVFKWKKYDICSQAVYEAAPDAREVYLYCRGNTAVLRSWAYNPGLHKMKNLERLVIEINTHDENEANDCEDFKEDMKRILAENCKRLDPDRIEISIPRLTSIHGPMDGSAPTTQQDGISNKTSPTNELSPDAWIKALAPFKKYAEDIAKAITKEPLVKIAILDDGASLEPLKPHYFSRSALSVYQQALKWALDMDVDIISMSWSFKLKDKFEDKAEADFKEILDKAVRKCVVFASLPDKGAMAEISNYMPVGNGNVIRIGSATVYGEDIKQNKFAPKHFLLPGEEIEVTKGEFDNGSSYATAHAAGLAGLVLHFLRGHDALENHYRREKSNLSINPAKFADDRLKEAKTTAGMRKIFKVLSGSHADTPIPDEGFFVRPFTLLKEKDMGGSAGDQISFCRDIVPKLLPMS
ncbi:intracellular serine protease [Fusarium tjaetaba]|uniref:Intracellular serine protease n=1 Tax=Fusarium tjaetaba TaxID=1567544 RepID=A0A8H5QFV6_9HYPO|nr:intracellular serine protease [Fusarium tjaetaba]KAF5613086.1 intracellular serine protease [Fusarium tjaetaba]